MNGIDGLILHVDALLIAPYRWFGDPATGWFVGSFILAVWAVLLGELSLALAFRGNRAHIARLLGKSRYFHEQSLAARGAGERKAYAGINRLANEAYGKSFFLLLAMGMGSLWPAFFAMAWLDMRFGELSFSLPAWAGGAEPGVAAPFVVLYLLARFLMGRVRPLVIPSASRIAAP